MADKAYLGWPQFGDAMLLLASSMNGNGYDPDTIVGISRGGLPGAVCLSHLFDADLEVIEASYYEGEERQNELTIDLTSVPYGIEGEILVFDDMVDTGATMKRVVELLESQVSSDQITTASINVKPHREFDPEYWVEQTRMWVVYPWESTNE